MENELSFGTFEVPYLDYQESSWVSYTAPSILPIDLQRKVSFYNGEDKIIKQTERQEAPEDSGVTHKFFFGENIKRVLAAFK